MSLATRYLGLQLAHPIVAAASPLTATVDGMRRLEDAGAAAVVMASLYEEQIRAEDTAYALYTEHGSNSQAEAGTYFPELPDYDSATSPFSQEGQAQIERPPALLRALAKAMRPALGVDPVSHHVHRDGAGGHERTALRRVEHPVGLEHQGDRQDRYDVGDRDLPEHDQRLRAGEAGLRDHREDRGHRA